MTDSVRDYWRTRHPEMKVDAADVIIPLEWVYSRILFKNENASYRPPVHGSSEVSLQAELDDIKSEVDIYAVALV